MSGRQVRRSRYQRICWRMAFLFCCLGALCLAPLHAQQRREREPNSAYASRRASLAAQVDGPIVLWGFTGREEISQAYVFAQEENFYYLTGHNEESAALVLLPPAIGASNGENGETLLPPREGSCPRKVERPADVPLRSGH